MVVVHVHLAVAVKADLDLTAIVEFELDRPAVQVHLRVAVTAGQLEAHLDWATGVRVDDPDMVRARGGVEAVGEFPERHRPVAVAVRVAGGGFTGGKGALFPQLGRNKTPSAYSDIRRLVCHNTFEPGATQARAGRLGTDGEGP